MNENFENLMYRAGLTADGCWNDMDSYDQGAVMKFAELIVRECIKICSDVEADTEMDLSDGALVCMAEIKEHFGVE